MAIVYLKKLGPKHQRAIELFVAGETAPVVAKELKVSLGRVYVWKLSPVFASALDEARKLARTEGIDILKNSTRKAAHYLVKAVSRTEGADERPVIDSVGVKAATELLDRAGLLSQLDPGGPGIDITDHKQVLALLRLLPPNLLLEALKKTDE